VQTLIRLPAKRSECSGPFGGANGSIDFRCLAFTAVNSPDYWSPAGLDCPFRVAHPVGVGAVTAKTRGVLQDCTRGHLAQLATERR